MRDHIKIIFVVLACLLSVEAYSQHYLGVRGGYSGGFGRFDSKRLYNMPFQQNGPSGGISWRYYGEQPVVGGLQADLQYVTKGYKRDHFIIDEDGIEVVDSTYSRTIDAIELPFMWQIHCYAFDRKMRIYINLGVYASYFLSSYEYQEGRSLGEGVKVGQPYEFNSVRDNRFEYGLVGGLGFGYLFKRFEVFVEARYNFGYSDILKAPNKNPGNDLNRTPIDMINISAGIYYRLGKRGILARPAKENGPKVEWSTIPPPPGVQ